MMKIYSILLKSYKPQGWWPLSKGKIQTKHHNGPPKNDKDRFEIIVGAILTQNTSWKNVELAIENLNRNNLLSIEKIRKIPVKKLARLIRSSGYHNQKADRLKIMANYLSKNQIKKLFKKPAQELRKELLSIKGIGPETADSIILYSAQKPVFVVDAYTKRIFSRIGLINEKADYDEIQNFFMKKLENKTKIFKEYHALIVEHAKIHCKTKPLCGGCPIKKLCRYK